MAGSTERAAAELAALDPGLRERLAARGFDPERWLGWGRTIGGEMDPLGQPWRMGANEPTTIHLPFPARIGTVDLDPGSYSLYAIPAESEWTVVINSNTNRWGIPISPDVRAADVGSVVVRPGDPGSHVETLTFSFRGSGSSGTLTYAWERFTFDLPISRR